VLSAGEGLTSARWQVLGAIDAAGRPLTVPQIARHMGLTRQSVHATVKRLIADRLVELEPNVDHRRSPLVRITEQGERRYAAIDTMQIAWVNRLARGISRSDLETTRRVLDELCGRLGSGVEPDGDEAQRRQQRPHGQKE
jgi:DNA-binding MarR family transcriptional regulator